MGGPGSGRKRGSGKGKASIPFAGSGGMHGYGPKTIGRKSKKIATTGRVKLSKGALKRREEKYGKEAASKMSKWSE